MDPSSLISEIIPATPRVRYVEGTWRLLHARPVAATVEMRVGETVLRGRRPPAGETPRILELR